CCRGRLLQRPARAHDFHPSFPTRRSSDLAVLWGVLRGRAGERERRCQRMAIRVVIADDHPLLRQGLVKILSMEPDMEVVAEAQRSEEHTSELQSRENLVCRLLLEITNQRS